MSIAAEVISMAHAAVEDELSDSPDEVSLDQLSAGDRILVTTLNHTYEIVATLQEREDLLVRGGHFFPDFTPIHLAGSLAGRGVLELGTIRVGKRLELIHRGGPVVTTQVRRIQVVPAAA